MPAKTSKRTTNSEAAASPEEIRALLERVRDQLLQQSDAKATIGDYIRLLQLLREVEGDEPRDIEVRWVIGPDVEGI